MRIYTERDRIRRVFAFQKYRLQGLNQETCSAEEVDKALGSKDAAILVCHVCGCRVKEYVDIDHDEYQIGICLSCLKNAVTLLEKKS